ncbi:MAG TPA: replicative DNA helicase [Dongiaceae bacterium]|nr:replicative DNA helicase [Dongiaceae bacterium]
MESGGKQSNVARLREGAGAIPPRTPPHNYEAEQALLGALLANNEVYNRVSEFLRAEHFADALHGRIYEAVGKLVLRGQIANPVTLKNLFDQDGALSEIGGAQYLVQLAQAVVTVINAEDYGRAIHDLFLRRQLIGVGEDIVNESYTYDPEVSAIDQIERSEMRLFNLAEGGQVEGGPKKFDAVLKSALDMAEVAYKRDSHITGVTTGLRDLDRKLGGLQPSDLVILAGRPSMGKAQPLDALVRTTTGWKAMGDLKLGDKLASIDGRPSRVTGLFPQGRRQIYRVTFSDGRSAEACCEHLWRVHYRGWEAPRTLSTEQVIEMLKRKRYQGRVWVDHCSGHFGHSEALPVDPWVLGALLGDGNLKGGSARFSTASPDMLAELSTRLGASFSLRAAGGYDWRIVQSADHRRVGRQGVWPNPLKEALVGLGLWEITGEAKFVPEIYKSANRQARVGILRGLLDTDGWVESWGSVRFASCSERLARDVVELARSLGGWAAISSKATTYSYKGERRTGRRAWVVNIYHPQPKELFSIPEKVARASSARSRRKMPVICDISASRKAEAQCIAVSHPERLYITSDYVVTHNTALATNIGFNAAEAAKDAETGTRHRVAFFSLEMSAEQLAHRIMAEKSGVSSDRIRRGDVKSDDFGKIVEAAQAMTSVQFFIDDTPALTVPALRTRARRLKRQFGLDLVIVDYLQLMRSANPKPSENRVQEISEITRGLKAVAKELEVPVLALSQLSRAVENREDKRPQLADLRESGSIEQDADVVMFVYREQYYHERAIPNQRAEEASDKFQDRMARWQERGERIHNVAEVIIAKQRHGPVGTLELYFDGNITKFGDLTRDDDLPEHH